MEKESWKTLAIIVLVLVAGWACVLALDLAARLDVVTYDLKAKAARLDILDKSINLKPAACPAAECSCPTPAPPGARQEVRRIKRITTQHYSIEALARACAEGRLKHTGRIAILTGD